MNKILEQSAITNTVVTPDRVTWKQWKTFLSHFFTIPSDFKLSRYHCFYFCASEPTSVRVKLYSSDQTFSTFNLLKNNVNIELIRKESMKFLTTNVFSSKLPLLQDVSSAHDGNRGEYLIKNVLKPYFPRNKKMKRELLDE